MSIHVALRHVTHYTYDRPVTLGPQIVRLRPAPYCRSKILSYSLRITPDQHFINWQQDPQANYLARLVFPEKTREFRVEVDLVTEMAVYNPFDFFLEPNAERFPFTYDPVLASELEPYQRCLPLTLHFAEYLEMLRASFGGLDRAVSSGAESVPHSEVAIDPHTHGRLPEAGQLHPDPEEDPRPRTIDFLVGLNQRLSDDIKYLIRMEPGVQTPEETLIKGSGSCRDSAWLLCQLLRHCGLAARFVSGYLIQLKPDVEALDGPSGATEDFTDLHAWCEVYLPGAGWIGLDATSGLLAGEGHIPLAATPEPQSAAPISGGVEPCESEFHFEMSVTRIHESPRVTQPYTREQWAAIDALGRRIDEDLVAGDVRLTMGGEPTFVSIDDPDGDEWNNAAVGPRKRLLSGELIRRLRQRFGPGGLLHYGQGKWYPGEQLPRWALGCYWRKDGVPVWADDSLIADEAKDYGHGAREARAFIDQLSQLIDVDPRWILPAYEDVYYYLWKERRLPSNVDPLKSNLKDQQERERLARIFEQGLGAVAGYALPVKSNFGRWQSGPWFLRDETLWLIPGDSPMGLRLPLDSLPWVKSGDYPWVLHPDPLLELPPLPPRPDRAGQRFVAGREEPRDVGYGRGQRRQRLGELPPESTEDEGARRPAPGQSAAWITRTALCIEPRHGRLHVFMPPVQATEDYLDLIAAIEETARRQGLPVIVEGEAPPRDPRLNAIKVTPDPGVIEVNLHPASTWDELSFNTQTLYQEARLTRLGTEKFMLDGRHTGTGGGNHIVIGGPSPADSPLLRRPDLLRSLVAYWHNHPSLSYLFSGLFIGPTSQAPRVDEARNDSLYELEIAFKQIPERGEVPPWLVDRIFRNLLIDVTGNTHRAEFCIDKLFSPDSSAGRLGLLELRNFEMPPHAEMSLAQHLLLRGAIARFWRDPYTPQKLARWGTELHDRYLLPHFVWQDFTDVLADFTEAGYALDPAWFAPHFEFKFPSIGSIAQRGVSLEIRTALEPWHVLGEESGGGGTVRYVDSSLERVQVKVSGLTNTRHLVTCNGRRLPLHPTGIVGEYVAGVRYRAWQPPTCLQPTIGVHSPLVFDLLDTWNDRSVAGCTYHVAHPGGRNYVTFPINAYEAESRRLNRFFPHGHTPGKVIAPGPETNPEFPLTLDLRT